MKLYSFLTIPFLAISLSSFGQINRDSLYTFRYNNYRLPKHTIKFSPLHLLDFYPTFQLGYERKIKQWLSVQTDIGYVLNENVADYYYRNKRGLKASIEGRRYLPGNIYASGISYIAAEAYINAINYDKTVITTGCFDLSCQSRYEQTLKLTVKYRETGFSLKIGRVYGRQNVIFDIALGIDLRFITYKKPDYATVASNVDLIDFKLDLFAPDESSRIQFSPFLGMRIGYRFYKRDTIYP